MTSGTADRRALGTGPAGRSLLVGALAVGIAVLAGFVVGVPVGTAAGVLAATSATRAVMDVAGVACVGVALVAVLVPMVAPARSHTVERAALAVHRRVDGVLVGAAGAWLTAVAVAAVVRAADAFGVAPGRLGSAELVAWTTRLGAGRGLVLTAVCAAVVLVAAVVRLRDPDRVAVRIPLVAALLGMLTPAVTGHAGSAANHELAVVSVALHAGAAAVWVGGLAALALLVAPHRALLDAALPVFSTLAGTCLAAVGVTGVLNAVVRLGTWDALLTTGYGWLVLAKVVVLALIGVLGLLTRARLRAGRLPVLRWVGAEVTLMAVAIGLAAALTRSGP